MMRIGFGYDIHRIIRGNKLRLGGVSFPRAGFCLVGHSDADVLIHALCDALLGAAGEPDIGVLFPNTSARHRQRNSLEFLQAVSSRLRKRGFSIINVDCTLVAQAPKIAPRVALMKTRLAKALGSTPAQIGIKATTNEGLGFIGRREGLAAFAVALVQQILKK
jgi:2-C-methyl-D-erythritol 2,4-cyclodiphosphate synthase